MYTNIDCKELGIILQYFMIKIHNKIIKYNYFVYKFEYKDKLSRIKYLILMMY